MFFIVPSFVLGSVYEKSSDWAMDFFELIGGNLVVFCKDLETSYFFLSLYLEDWFVFFAYDDDGYLSFFILLTSFNFEPCPIFGSDFYGVL